MVLLLCAVFNSCTTIHYESRNKIPIYIGPRKGHNYFSQVKGEIQFFLWGLYPGDQTVYLDKVIQSRGVKSAANVRIREYQTISNIFYSLISLGMFYPVNYEITSYGVLPQRNDFVEIPE